MQLYINYMNPIKDLIKYEFKEIKSRRSQRGDLLEQFCEKINSDRDGLKYKKITIARMSGLLKGVDMYSLFKECEKSTNFGKLFWWKLKNKK